MTTDTMTAQDHRTAAKEARHREAESWERSDTDGFLSQWASNITAQEHDLAAEIADRGGKWEYRSLFDLAGNLVPAKSFDSQFGGTTWGLLDVENITGPYIGYVNESKARNPKTFASNMAKKGYVIGSVNAPAKAILGGGNGTGLGGAMNVRPFAWRSDGGFDAAAEIVDNGQATLKEFGLL